MVNYKLREFRQKNRKLQRHLTAAFQYLKGLVRKIGTDVLARPVLTGQGVTV